MIKKKKSLTTRKRFNTNHARSRGDLSRFADIQLERLLVQMEMSGIEQDSRSFKFEDGSKVSVFHSYGVSYVDINVSGESIDEKLKSLAEASLFKRFFVEILDPDFAWDTHRSHSLYWICPLQLISQRMDVILKDICDEGTTGQAINNAIIKVLTENKAKIGEHIALIPFDFEDISDYYPKGEHGGEYGKWSIDGWHAFREAKSFVAEFDDNKSRRYIGYNAGSLINSTEKKAFELIHPTGLKKYQQFHKVGDYLHWFGISEQDEEGIPLMHHVHSQSMKIDATAGEIIKLGGFIHFDYRGVANGFGGLTKIDTSFGNIFATLTPPTETNGLVSIDDDHVVLHLYDVDIPSFTVHAEGGGVGEEGKVNGLLTYEHKGEKESDPDWIYENIAGEISTEYMALLWGTKGNSVCAGWTYKADMPRLAIVDAEKETYGLIFKSIVDIEKEYYRDKIFKNTRVSLDEDYDQETEEIIYRYINNGTGMAAESVWCDASAPTSKNYTAVRGGYRYELSAFFPAKEYTRIADEIPRSLPTVIGSGFSFLSDGIEGRFKLAGEYAGPHEYTHGWYSDDNYKEYKNCGTIECQDEAAADGKNCGQRYYTSVDRPVGYTIKPQTNDLYGGHAWAKNEEDNYGDQIRGSYSCYDTGYASVKNYFGLICGCLEGTIAPVAGDIIADCHDVNSGSVFNYYTTLREGAAATYGLTNEGTVAVISNAPSRNEWAIAVNDRSGPYNLTNGGRISVPNSSFTESMVEYEKNYRVLVYLENFELSIDGCLSSEGRYTYNIYTPQYALLDDRACGGALIVFVGVGEEPYESLSTLPIDQWHILLQIDEKRVDIFDDLFDTLGLDKSNMNQIVDMGMF